MTELKLDVRWGGYYSYNEDGVYHVFRLLDLAGGAYHAQLFRDEFKHTPAKADLTKLDLFALHAPITAEALLEKSELELVGHEPLSAEDLEGYATYLDAMGLNPDEIKQTVEEIMDFSEVDEPVKLVLWLENGVLQTRALDAESDAD